jgi:chitodextrinase
VVLAAPANLEARSVFGSATRIEVSWEDRTGPRETGFELQRRQQGTATSTTIAILGANVTSFLDTGLLPGTKYFYQVRALAENSFSSFSNTDDATTGIVPVAPSRVRAAALGPDRVEVSWQDNSRFEAGFRVERQGPEGPFRPAGTVPTDATTFTDEGLEPRTTYRYRVFAFNDGGDSPSSETAAVTTGRPVGGRLRFAPARLAFGVVYSGRAREQQVTVRNASATEDLRVTTRTAEGPFSVGGPGELLIPPGGRRVLKVRFRPAGRGQARGRLVLESSDPRRPREVVPLTGWGVAVR